MNHDQALAAATAIACRLAQPGSAVITGAGRRRAQSLAQGAAGIALVHIERARTRLGPWDVAHAWLTTAASGTISAGSNAGLFNGAPAVAFALHAAGGGRYPHALARLDQHVAALADRKVSQARERIRRRELPALAEFDLIYGLTGIGSYLLRRQPAAGVLERILSYLVQLTEPLRIAGEELPGWWTSHDPSFNSSAKFAGGHANFGMAHGIAGPLALLSIAFRNGITVSGQDEAINRICTWLDTWRQAGSSGTWWPQWITRQELRARRSPQPSPGRPSWCYGIPGLARAQQLAGIAAGDTARQDMAEQALAGILADPAHPSMLTGTSLCHGLAGLFQTIWHAARDARTPSLTASLPHLAALLTRYSQPPASAGAGLLEGQAGLALALHTAASNAPPASGWDQCLLIA